MKVAALYDIHAMPWALQAVLADVRREGADAILLGGDVLGGPCEDETLALARSVDASWVRGNVEDAYAWAASLPLAVEIDGVTYCHATPYSTTPITTAITPDDALVAMFGPQGTFVIGHTHHQFDRRVGTLRVVNAGSVGMAYEGEVAAFWAFVDDGEPTFRKTPFDVERAVREIRAGTWAGGAEFITENLLRAVPRDEAIAALEAQR